jgi:hypothetical protein
MRKTISILSLVAVLSASASIALAGPVGPLDVTVQLHTLSSGEWGTAELSKYAGNQTKVVLSLNHVPGGANQPAHIHTGHCGAGLGAVKWPLSNVHRMTIFGYGPASSTTILNVPFWQINSGAAEAINLHQSSANLGHYMACGNL